MHPARWYVWLMNCLEVACVRGWDGRRASWRDQYLQGSWVRSLNKDFYMLRSIWDHPGMFHVLSLATSSTWLLDSPVLLYSWNLTIGSEEEPALFLTHLKREGHCFKTSPPHGNMPSAILLCSPSLDVTFPFQVAPLPAFYCSSYFFSRICA